MWLGVDDTDGPSGGCTTYVLTEIVAAAGREGFDLLGEPRLVRLNPNIPWKTRGNGALAARFGHGRGRRRQLGEIDGRPVWSYAAGLPLRPVEQARLLDVAWETVQRTASSDPRADPAVAMSPRRLSTQLYRSAVSSRITLRAALDALRAKAGSTRSGSRRRGLIGAAAAIAWPGQRATWELLAYREPSRVGTPRAVDASSVRSVAAKHPSLFLCYDERTRRLLVAPHTRCPILYGLRSTDPSVLRAAHREVRSEPVGRWLIFRTNQGTGDHARTRPIAGIGPYDSARVRGMVADLPVALPGGHVRFWLSDPTGRLECIVFEPTKTLPLVAQRLRPGDRVVVWGGRGRTGPLRVEGIAVQRLAAAADRRPPRCPSCHARTHSLGRARGYRCDRCRKRVPPEAAELRPEPRRLHVGVYHPTPSARRHIAPRGPEPSAERGDL